jgi:hypothetical protein
MLNYDYDYDDDDALLYGFLQVYGACLSSSLEREFANVENTVQRATL